MISETSLATGFSSFWSKTLPYSERGIRKINLGISEYLFKRAKASVAPTRKAFLNEIAFNSFCIDIKQGLDLARRTAEQPLLEEAKQLASSHQRKFRHVSDDFSSPTEEELKDIDYLIAGLNALVIQYPYRKLIVQPAFSGCGMLNASQGDLVINDVLYEIKGGDRNFRSIDVRQLLIYCAINSVDHTHPIRKAGCFNPRTGQHFKFSLDALSYELAGKSSSELFSEIIYFVSSGDVSR